MYSSEPTTLDAGFSLTYMPQVSRESYLVIFSANFRVVTRRPLSAADYMRQ
jgi:hypothetical protein